ncbi:FAD synthetase family protein [Neobacillus cucumis]|uniref:FAD synthetase family protein n=1 Tax=Neobacillus cucumis TaxID=1740721 RepID=UPI0018DFF072|nr:FAD synthetase family protein [Neobacillus cucumis]MBI0577916.1 FAD synthetase family protein [Neobacillus cucumis]
MKDTFYPHLKEVLFHQNFDYLMSLDRKIESFRSLGVEHLYVVHFDQEFANLEQEVFVQNYLLAFNVKEVVAGFDFTYGRKGIGNIRTLEAHGRGKFRVSSVAKVERYGNKISSTLIRDLLKTGAVSHIAGYLGGDYETVCKVPQVVRQSDFRIFKKTELEFSSLTMLPTSGFYEVELSAGMHRFKTVCQIIESHSNYAVMECELPKNLALKKDNQITIKWLRDWSEVLLLQGTTQLPLVIVWLFLCKKSRQRF